MTQLLRHVPPLSNLINLSCKCGFKFSIISSENGRLCTIAHTWKNLKPAQTILFSTGFPPPKSNFEPYK